MDQKFVKFQKFVKYNLRIDSVFSTWIKIRKIMSNKFAKYA